MESPLITHIFIEAFFNYKGMLTEEHIRAFSNRRRLFENYGIFNGCDDAAYEIEDAIIKNRDKTVIEVSPQSLSFINRVIIYLMNDSIGKGLYDGSKTKVNKDGTFDEIVIYINGNASSKEIITNLMHELTHAYQDYNLRKKGMTLDDEGERVGYNTTASYLHDKHNAGQMAENMATLFYLLNRYESGAHLTGLLMDTKEALANKQFDNLEAAVHYVKQHSRAIDFYNKVRRLTNRYCNPNLPLETKQLIVRAANKVSGYDFRNYKQLSNWIKRRTYKVTKKIERVLPKIVNNNMKVNGASVE